MSRTSPPLPFANLQTWHEPDHFRRFECIGAACEDTCCVGWSIGVDKRTYETYQSSTDPDLGPRLQRLVTITQASAGRHYASITLDEAQCPFLEDSLCSIQSRLGEAHLGEACATFPRVVNQVDGVIERSLDVSCPEAARLILLNPEPDVFQEFTGPVGLADGRLIELAKRAAARPQSNYADQVSSFALSILQNRAYPVAKRMLLLGHLSSELNRLLESGDEHLVGQMLEGFRLGIECQIIGGRVRQSCAEHAAGLGIILELVTARVSLDYTSPRYRELYGHFIQGLGIEANTKIPEVAERYADAYFRYYAPFMEAREYILEHYLVSYAYKNRFPFGSGLIVNQYLVMATYFAITRALAVGLAGYHRSSFSSEHIVSAIQVCARAMEHCTSYRPRVLQILANKGILVPAAMARLIQNPVLPACAHDEFATGEMLAVA